MVTKKGKQIPAVSSTINKSKLAGIGRYIDESTRPSGNCCFSFKYLSDDATFTTNHNDPDYYHKLIERLQVLSRTPALELMTNRSSALRCHPIDWKDKGVSRSCFGIPREEELYDTPYQISISTNKYGRMHGFFTGDIFNIVWLDREHALYSGKR